MKFSKKRLIIFISITLLLILVWALGNMVWIEALIGGVNTAYYKFQITAFDKLTVSSMEQKESKQLSLKDIVILRGYAAGPMLYEEYICLDGIDVAIRIGWRHHYFAYGISNNESLNKLVSKIVELSPIPFVNYSGKPIKPHSW